MRTWKELWDRILGSTSSKLRAVAGCEGNEFAFVAQFVRLLSAQVRAFFQSGEKSARACLRFCLAPAEALFAALSALGGQAVCGPRIG